MSEKPTRGKLAGATVFLASHAAELITAVAVYEAYCRVDDRLGVRLAPFVRTLNDHDARVANLWVTYTRENQPTDQ